MCNELSIECFSNMAANCGAGVHQGSPFNGHTSHSSNTAAAGSSGTSQGLKHDPGLAVEWSAEEQSLLEDGLSKFANESSILRCIKIAALLPEKNVRDVALRCRWMSRKENGKRRKGEEQNSAKKIKDKKEKLVDPLSKQAIPSVQRATIPAYALSMLSIDNESLPSFEQIGGTTGHLLEQNAKAFEQIAANLASYRIQENMNLLCRTRDNIVAILKDMKDMPGIMSQMPPLPVSLNEDLADSILPPLPQDYAF